MPLVKMAVYGHGAAIRTDNLVVVKAAPTTLFESHSQAQSGASLRHCFLLLCLQVASTLNTWVSGGWLSCCQHTLSSDYQPSQLQHVQCLMAIRNHDNHSVATAWLCCSDTSRVELSTQQLPPVPETCTVGAGMGTSSVAMLQTRSNLWQSPS